MYVTRELWRKWDITVWTTGPLTVTLRTYVHVLYTHTHLWTRGGPVPPSDWHAWQQSHQDSLFWEGSPANTQPDHDREWRAQGWLNMHKHHRVVMWDVVTHWAIALLLYIRTSITPLLLLEYNNLRDFQHHTYVRTYVVHTVRRYSRGSMHDSAFHHWCYKCEYIVCTVCCIYVCTMYYVYAILMYVQYVVLCVQYNNNNVAQYEQYYFMNMQYCV